MYLYDSFIYVEFPTHYFTCTTIFVWRNQPDVAKLGNKRQRRDRPLTYQKGDPLTSPVWVAASPRPGLSSSFWTPSLWRKTGFRSFGKGGVCFVQVGGGGGWMLGWLLVDVFRLSWVDGLVDCVFFCFRWWKGFLILGFWQRSSFFLRQVEISQLDAAMHMYPKLCKWSCPYS